MDKHSKHTRFLAMSAALAVSMGAPVFAQAGLAEARDPVVNAKWERRILIACGPSVPGDGVPALVETQSQLIDWAGYLERDLMFVWLDPVEIFSQTPHPNADPDKAATLAGMYHVDDPTDLRGRTGCTNGEARIVLIGKDGGVKQTWERPVPNAELFAIIDAMPMRAQEMRRND